MASINDMPFYNISNDDFNSNFESGSSWKNLSRFNDMANKTYCIKNKKHAINMNYLTVDGLKYKGNKNITLQMIHLNNRSLNKNADNLKIMLDRIGFEMDFIILSEIDIFNIEIYTNYLANYKFVYCFPVKQNIGGLGIFYNNSLTIKKRMCLLM